MKVVIQQALFHHFGLPVGRIANLAAINPRTAWNYIHVAQKSHIKPWNTRSAAQQDIAIKEASLIIKGKQPMFARRAQIPAQILHAMIDAEINNRVQANDRFTAYAITLLLRAMNPDHEIVHSEVQARVRYVMLAYGNYEMVFQNWNGQNARTWRPAQIASGVRIVDDD